MKFGVKVAQIGPAVSRDAVLTLARLAEELGYEAIHVTDHLIFPSEIGSPDPLATFRSYQMTTAPPHLEAVTLLSFLAACTQRAQLVTNVLVLAQRHPVEMAKMLACVDVLSGGRLVVGIGAGWLAEEFALLGVPFQRRGERTDEYIRLLRILWTEPEAGFEGEFYRIRGARLTPKPLQLPHPPLWIGGNSQAAVKRVGELGDGWMPTDSGDEPLEMLVEKFKTAQRYASEHGRDPNVITFNILPPVLDPYDRPRAVLERMERYRAAGVSTVMLRFPILPTAEAALRAHIDGFHWFAREVRPALGL